MIKRNFLIMVVMAAGYVMPGNAWGQHSYGESQNLYPDNTGYRNSTGIAKESSINQPISLTVKYPDRNRLAVKTNVIYFATLSPNLGIEAAISPRFSVEFSAGLNPLKKDGKEKPLPPDEEGQPNQTLWEDGKSSKHWQLKGELRYWFDKPFSKHLVGVALFYGKFDWGGREVPFLFEKEFFYDGKGFGAGVVYGYHCPLSRKLHLELTIGAGIISLDYDRRKTDHPQAGMTHYKKKYYGPTQLGAKLVFMI